MATSLRERALRYLSRREHARVELARKLSAHAEHPEEVETLLDDLDRRGLLSDERYVEMRINARGSRYGNARLMQELRAQGISDKLIDEGLSASENEVTRAREVWQKKYGKKENPVDAAEHLRQRRFLMSRGFSGETIRRVLRGNFEDE